MADGAVLQEVPFDVLKYVAIGGMLFGCTVYLCMLNTASCKQILITQIPLHIVLVFTMCAWAACQRLCPGWEENLDNPALTYSIGDAKAGFAMSQYAQLAAYTLTYLSFTIPMALFFNCRAPHEDVESRTTRPYLNAAKASFVEHLVYFGIFVNRQLTGENDVSKLDMRRPLETEFDMLVNSYVKPIFPTANSTTLLESYVTGQNHAINEVADFVLADRKFGSEFWWYQMFEGINHGIICVGALLVIFAAKKHLQNKTMSKMILFSYEYAMIAELIVYGPQYFWMLSINLFNMTFNSPYGLETSEGQAIVLASFFIVVCHHLGYWVDTWASWEIAVAWGWTTENPLNICKLCSSGQKDKKGKKKSKKGKKGKKNE